jgi:hypothetical protein
MAGGKKSAGRKTLTFAPSCVLYLFMFSPPDRTQAQDQMLAEFSELSMDLARDAAKRAKATEDATEAANLMLAFERMGRSLRLTISLQRRLTREQAARRAEAVETRRQQVRTVLLPQVRAQTDHLGERYEREAELDERLAEQALHEAFADLPLETCLERLRTLLDLPHIPFPLEGGRVRDGGGARSAPLRPAGSRPTNHTNHTNRRSNGQARAGPS